MITNRDRTQAISNLGWVDKGALWLYTAGEPTSRKVALSDAKHLSIKAGTDDFFAVVHHWDSKRLEVSAHTHAEPDRVISRISLRSEASPVKPTILFEGERSVWEKLPRAFTGYAFGDYQLLWMDHQASSEVQTFPWFDDSYDKDYQGINGVTEIPGDNLLIVSIARDSNPVLYDPGKKQAIRKLTLAGRRGYPEFRLRASANEFWASDYDCLVKLDAKTLMPRQAVRLQEPDSKTMQFIGNFCFDAAESVCLVARPFSGDAVVLEADSMRQLRSVPLGGQPMDIGLLANGTVVARDWKTGEILLQKL